MGLDMYLSAVTYCDNHELAGSAERARFRKLMEDVGAGDFSPASSIPYCAVKLLVADWKNAYAIDRWIVGHSYESGEDAEREIPRENLQKLLELCQHLLQKKNRREASRLLPPPDNLFRNREDLEYFEYFWQTGYWCDLKSTIRQISPVLAKPTFDCWEFYHRS